MKLDYIEEQTFDKTDFTQQALAKAEYEYCHFTNCNFLNADLSEIRFINCEFVDCNLSGVNLQQTSFQEVSFKDCKLLGLHFEDCKTFSFAVNFTNCQLNHSSFYQVKMSKTRFVNTNLQEVDFTETDLSLSAFTECDLLNATFENTNLEKADLTTAFNYSIDPELNRIKGAKFSLPAVTGLLHKYQIQINQ